MESAAWAGRDHHAWVTKGGMGSSPEMKLLVRGHTENREDSGAALVWGLLPPPAQLPFCPCLAGTQQMFASSLVGTQTPRNPKATSSPKGAGLIGDWQPCEGEEELVALSPLCLPATRVKLAFCLPQEGDVSSLKCLYIVPVRRVFGDNKQT